MTLFTLLVQVDGALYLLPKGQFHHPEIQKGGEREKKERERGGGERERGLLLKAGFKPTTSRFHVQGVCQLGRAASSMNQLGWVGRTMLNLDDEKK